MLGRASRGLSQDRSPQRRDLGHPSETRFAFAGLEIGVQPRAFQLFLSDGAQSSHPLVKSGLPRMLSRIRWSTGKRFLVASELDIADQAAATVTGAEPYRIDNPGQFRRHLWICRPGPARLL